MELNKLKDGDRIKLNSTTDWWTKGTTCLGTIITIGQIVAMVQLDHTQRIEWTDPSNILQVVT